MASQTKQALLLFFCSVLFIGSGCSSVYNMPEDDFELILLPPSLEFWGYKHGPSRCAAVSAGRRTKGMLVRSLGTGCVPNILTTKLMQSNHHPASPLLVAATSVYRRSIKFMASAPEYIPE